MRILITLPKYINDSDMKLSNKPFPFKSCILLLLILTIPLLSIKVNAQVRPNLGGTSQLMNNALMELKGGNYERANAYFRQIIDSGLPIPQEMPYYFAETLFHLGQYDNSANFLNKYLQINGFRGDNYESARALESRLKAPLDEIQSCQLCDRRGYQYQVCHTCEGHKEIEQPCNHCKEKGVVGCSRCVGSGLVTIRNVFNIVEYYECEKCSGKGRYTCPTCLGSKFEVSSCRTCDGSGRLPTDIICDHEGENEVRHLTSMMMRKLKASSHP